MCFVYNSIHFTFLIKNRIFKQKSLCVKCMSTRNFHDCWMTWWTVADLLLFVFLMPNVSLTDLFVFVLLSVSPVVALHPRSTVWSPVWSAPGWPWRNPVRSTHSGEFTVTPMLSSNTTPRLINQYVKDLHQGCLCAHKFCSPDEFSEEICSRNVTRSNWNNLF